ncbi:Uncharacterized protein PCOAH_00020880 [Plasmodium coatneyi]|uniref:Uncharacterized protein n=1 Tax=Plasmodium coatneyi TaxID=208452 RepID=A0A1B1DYY3_9APIC|nr:Uncharacterized protein PCOAH_00020880 [Plasmodium coatneyi]ANQ07996.1 Uncharacterized protein PCOAH_00020880 [Plasmodium coatneyi]
MEGGNSVVRMLLYFALFIQCTAAYSFSQSKNREENGNVFFTPMLTKDVKESHFKGTSQNAQESYTPRKERNATKIKKNMNNLFKTLYPNEAQMEERNRKEWDYQGGTMQGVHDEQGTQVNNRSHDEGVHSNRRKGGFPSGNVLNRELPSIYPVGQGGETTDHSVSGVDGEEKTIEHHSGENVEDNQKSSAKEQSANQQSPMELLGKSEQLKSESNFSLLDYLKGFFQKSTYIKKFQNFIELFFNKYDQRVLESTIFFNFDETLF